MPPLSPTLVQEGAGEGGGPVGPETFPEVPWAFAGARYWIRTSGLRLRRRGGLRPLRPVTSKVSTRQGLGVLHREPMDDVDAPGHEVAGPPRDPERWS